MTICLWNKCNNRCLMCSNPRDFNNQAISHTYSYNLIVDRINAMKSILRSSNEDIFLTGGEPTIHPDFLKIITYIKLNLPHNKLILVTNARLFSYYLFAEKCLPLINDIRISIHGHDAKSHDFITNINNSFEQAIQGVDNIFALKKKNKSYKLDIEIRTVLTKPNYKNLGKTLNFLRKKFIDLNKVIIIFPEFEGISKDNINRVGITYNKALPILQKEVPYWANQFKDIRLYHFPLCVLTPNLWPYVWRTLPAEEIVFLNKCHKCLYKKYCLGIHMDYPGIMGEKEFQPITLNQGKMKINKGNNFIYHPIIAIK